MKVSWSWVWYNHKIPLLEGNAIKSSIKLNNPTYEMSIEKQECQSSSAFVTRKNLTGSHLQQSTRKWSFNFSSLLPLWNISLDNLVFCSSLYLSFKIKNHTHSIISVVLPNLINPAFWLPSPGWVYTDGSTSNMILIFKLLA